MNFKPTKWKIIICLIVLILATLTSSYIVAEYYCFHTIPVCDLVNPEPCESVDLCNIWRTNILIPNLLIPGGLFFIVIYVIWSLIQKNER